MVWLAFSGKHSTDDLQTYINTGRIGQAREDVMPYNAMARELIGKELDKAYGGKS